MGGKSARLATCSVASLPVLSEAQIGGSHERDANGGAGSEMTPPTPLPSPKVLILPHAGKTANEVAEKW